MTPFPVVIVSAMVYLSRCIFEGTYAKEIVTYVYPWSFSSLP